MSTEYQKLRALLKSHFRYTLIAYPGSVKPRLKLTDHAGLTILYAAFDTVIERGIDELDKAGVEYDLGDNDNDE
ncbi:MAG: hypothetical protein ACC707_18410 [Thiohalomonadales bacterium]